MTKIFSAAGIRVGTLLSTKKNIKNIKNFEPLWKISEFDMHYLLQVLKDKNFVQKTKNKTTQNRKRLISTVQKHPLVKKVFKSHANYILVKLQNICATKLQEKLAKHNIMIRNGGNFDCLDDSYVRIAVKSKKSIKQLQTAIKSI